MASKSHSRVTRMVGDTLPCERHPVAFAEAVCLECLLDLEEQLEAAHEALHEIRRELSCVTQVPSVGLFKAHEIAVAVLAAYPAKKPNRPVQKRGGYQPNAAGSPPTQPPPKPASWDGKSAVHVVGFHEVAPEDAPEMGGLP